MRLLLLLLFTVSAMLCSQERIFYLSGENLQEDSVQRFLQPGGEHLPQVVPDGYRGAGLRFDGQDTLLRLKPAPELAFAVDQSFTVELYYFPEKVSRADGEMYWAGLVTRGSFAGSFWRLRSHSLKGTPLFQGTNRENGKMVLRSQMVRKIQEMAEQWHHVALVRDAHKRLLSFYHNGVLIKQEFEVDPQVFENPGQDLLIGQHFTGLIDELSIYDGIRHTFSPPQNEAAPEQAAIAVDAALQTNWQACRERGLHLYPMPKELHFSGQEFAFNPAAWSVQRHNGTDAPGLQAFRQRLQDCGLTDALAEGEGTGNLIVSGLFADLPTELALLSSPALPPRQGYVLGFAGQPGQRRIILAGSDEDGLRYAWLTLGNLLREGGSIFPALIRDWPDCLRRGIEISGPLSSDFVDMAFRMRINLLHRGRHAYSSDKDREQVRQFNDYAFERGILVEIAFHTNVLDLGPDYQKYITPGYNSHYYMYKPEEGLFGYLNGAYSWSRDDLARARGQQLAKEMKDLHFRSIYFHAIDRGGFNDPGNWARRLPQDRERWGDDQASADAHLLSIYVEELRREIPDIVIYYVQYPYVPTKDAKVLKYYRDLSAKLDGKVIHLLREAPRQLLASTVAAFRHPPRMCFYPYPFTVYPSYSNSGRFVASLYFGLQTIVRVCHWNPTSSLALASDWVFAEYLWNPFSPGAEPLPPDKHTLPVVLAPSEPIEQELLPRICALFFGEKAAAKMARIFAYKFSDRIPEQPHNILPAGSDHRQFFDRMITDSQQALEYMQETAPDILPRAKGMHAELNNYLQRCNLLARARRHCLQARELLDAGQADAALAEAARGRELLELPVARARNRYQAILNDLDIANAINLTISRREYLATLPEKKLRVAFYTYAGSSSGGGIIGLLPASLDQQGGLQVTTIDNLTRRNLQAVDVLVFNGNHSEGDCDENWRENILAFAQAGGGVIFTHNACGRHQGGFQPPLFPHICRGFDSMYVHSQELSVKDAGCFENFLQPGDIYTHAYFDHCQLLAGPEATLLLANASERPVTLAGNHGRGRVIYTGEIFGIDRQNRLTYPEFPHWQMLFNLIRWCGSAE